VKKITKASLVTEGFDIQEETMKGNHVNKELTAALNNAVSLAQHLPIAKHRELIVKSLEDDRVVIISGDTGCGKTT